MEAIILNGFVTYFTPAVFVGASLFGDAAIIAAFVFALRTHVPIWEVLSAALLGTITADMVWYSFGKHILALLKGRFSHYYEKQERMFRVINKFVPVEKPWLLLLITKFLYGTRILTVIYLSLNRVTFRKFIVFDAFITFIYLGVLFIFTKLAVFGTHKLLASMNDIGIALLALVISFIVVRVFSKWITERFQVKKS